MTQTNSDSQHRIPLGAAILLTLAVFALNLFVFGPEATRLFNDLVGNLVYVGVRVLTILGFGYCLGRFYGRTRMSVISLVTLVAFLEQVGLKLILFMGQMKANPQDWQEVTPPMLLLNLGMSYILFVPVLCLLAFGGYELSRVFPSKRAPR